MTRYVLDIELPEGATLELSTGFPHSAEMVDNVVELSTAAHAPAHSSGIEGLGRSVGSGGARLRLREATPEASLTEDDLILAHGGLHLVTDSDA